MWTDFSWLTAPVFALPVDLFRILAGGVLLWYFTRTYRQATDFTDPDGLIDHELSQRLFPPTRLSLFHPGTPAVLVRAAILVAGLCSILVLVGVQPRPAAAVAFVIAVSTYRWNLLVVYVDDAIMHLLCLWLVLMPVGETLVLAEWVWVGSAVWQEWSSATVPGTTVRLFLANMALVYVVAGVYKFTSTMWREGTALHAILLLPIARFPSAVRPGHEGWLRVANYAALALEPVFPLIYVLPAGSLAKWLLAVGVVAFHMGIILTLRIPFANAAMLGALPIAFAPEIMTVVGGLATPIPSPSDAGLGPSGVLAAALVTALALMVVWEVVRSGRLSDLPLWKTHMSGFLGNPLCVVLWLAGIAQSYRLFDWVDTRNYHVRYELRRVEANGSSVPADRDPRIVFPTSLRHRLLQSYLVGNVWLQLDRAQRGILRERLLERHAQRLARLKPEAGTIDVFAIVQRVTSDNLRLERGERRHLARFVCEGGRGRVTDWARAG